MRFSRRPSLLATVWIVVGLVVAATQDYFDNLETWRRILSALLAILLWPLLLVGFDVRVYR